MNLLLYDGECKLCNSVVDFTIKHDRKDIFKFASLQSTIGAEITSSIGYNPVGLTTFVVVLGYATSASVVLTRSDAAIALCEQLAVATTATKVLKILPPQLRDLPYRLISKTRYSIWGKQTQCRLYNDADRAKFID